ncbi:Cytochrome c [Roseovarius azorensis]|uniref:Cytochrome c n=1 Tax=Roseovarius azorensis TaxID=1287727 RepID=A0A1H7UED6_9RHOB|nr:cytochrome c [Roseovarius azorensis]SEL95422.1 Cytochrome c [Roseovarius azorensis]
MRQHVMLAVVCAGILCSYPASADQTGGLLPYRDAEAVARGAEIYAATCAACHGEQLQGAPNWKTRDAEGYLPAPPHDETGHTWHHPDALLLELVRRGTAAVVGQGYRSRMPGYAGELTEAEMRDVLAYIKSTWPKRVIEVHDRINAEAGG